MTPAAALPSQPAKAGRLRIAAAYYATYVVLGLMLTAIGPSLDALRAQSGTSTEAIAILFTANALGYIAGSLLAGQLYGRIAGHRVLAAALVILAALTLAVPALGSLAPLVVAFALIGIPLGVIDVGGNTLLVWLYRDDVAPYMNALHLSFGVGAVIGPLVFALFDVAAGNAATTYWLFAALMLPVALWVARLPSPVAPIARGTASTAASSPGIFRRHAWLIGLIVVFFFLHMGGEMAFGGWIFTYADGVTGSSTAARLVNAAFWGGLVVGRLVAIPLSMRLSPQAMLHIDFGGALASLAVMLLLPASVPVLWVGTIAFGFAVASLVPSSFNLAERRMPITGPVSAAFLVGGSVGTMTLPWLVGQLFVSQGPLALLVVTAAAMLAAWAVLAVIVRRRVPGKADGRPVAAPSAAG